MKMIVAYIHSFMSEKVTDTLREKHVHGMTVLSCRGFGRLADGKTPHYLDQDVALGFGEKTKIEIVCPDAAVADIVRIIQESARTGRHGDGKIFVSEILEAVDIRTGAGGEGAI